MKWCLGLSATAFLAGLLAMPCRAGDVADYLTKEGKLKEGVTVRIGGRQVFAPADEVWIIRPSGDWAWEFTDSKGKLNSKQLAALAQHLATQDFNSLPKMQGYEPKDSGYQYVVIAFGKKEAAFYTKSGESPADYVPKPGDPQAAAWSRFIALELVLADMLQMSEVRAEYGIRSGRGKTSHPDCRGGNHGSTEPSGTRRDCPPQGRLPPRATLAVSGVGIAFDPPGETPC